MKKQSITAEIEQAQVAIENTMNQPEIQKKLATYNYDRKKMLEGKGLYETMRLLNNTKQDKYGKQYASTDALQVQMKEVKVRYRRHLKSARLAFEDQRGVMEQLQLKGKRKPDTVGWLEQVYTFYSKIGEFTEQMSRYNVSPEELSQTRAMVEALYSARQQQLQRKGDAQHATEKRDQVRKELKAWMSRFKKTARLALQDDPQLLEGLGIFVPSRKV